MESRRWGIAPINGNVRHFLAVTLPVSVLFWLVYELLNLRFPQWRYQGEPESTGADDVWLRRLRNGDTEHPATLVVVRRTFLSLDLASLA